VHPVTDVDEPLADVAVDAGIDGARVPGCTAPTDCAVITSTSAGAAAAARVSRATLCALMRRSMLTSRKATPNTMATMTARRFSRSPVCGSNRAEAAWDSTACVSSP
jgi:hypothetical protein